MSHFNDKLIDSWGCFNEKKGSNPIQQCNLDLQFNIYEIYNLKKEKARKQKSDCGQVE